MGKYEFVDRPHTGGWILEIRRDGSHLGNVRKNRVTGRYQFFRGSRNAIRPMLEEADLATLKESIERLDL